MEIAVQIIQQIPPIWPRVAALLGLVLLFFLPESRRLVLRKAFGDQKTEQLMNLLQLRKLELEVAALKAANPEALNSAVEDEIQEIQRQPVDVTTSGDSLDWSDRVRYALAGAFSGMLISSMALWVMDYFHVVEPTHVLLKESVVTLVGGLLASTLPSRARWYCVFRGLLIPAIVAALSVVARGRF